MRPKLAIFRLSETEIYIHLNRYFPSETDEIRAPKRYFPSGSDGATYRM